MERHDGNLELGGDCDRLLVTKDGDEVDVEGEVTEFCSKFSDDLAEPIG